MYFPGGALTASSFFCVGSDAWWLDSEEVTGAASVMKQTY
jgi:hypothetical protein